MSCSETSTAPVGAPLGFRRGSSSQSGGSSTPHLASQVTLSLQHCHGVAKVPSQLPPSWQQPPELQPSWSSGNTTRSLLASRNKEPVAQSPWSGSELCCSWDGTASPSLAPPPPQLRFTSWMLPSPSGSRGTLSLRTLTCLCPLPPQMINSFYKEA